MYLPTYLSAVSSMKGTNAFISKHQYEYVIESIDHINAECTPTYVFALLSSMKRQTTKALILKLEYNSPTRHAENNAISPLIDVTRPINSRNLHLRYKHRYEANYLNRPTHLL